MASIAGLTIFGWRGEGVQLSEMQTRLAVRDGVSGTDVVQIGVRGKTFKMTAMVDCTTALNLALAKIAFSNLAGQRVTVVDNFGSIWYGFLVQSVTHIKEERRISAVGGSNAGTYWLESQFELLPLATYY